MASSFHLFPQLPAELRHRVWGLSAYPREVIVKRHEIRIHELEQCFCSPTPPPAVLQACREAYYFLVESACYVKSFVHETCPRYIWVNFAVDTIRAFAEDSGLFRHETSLIQRLILDEKPFPAYTTMLNLNTLHSSGHIDFISQFAPLETLTVFVPEPFGNQYFEWLYLMEDLDEALLRCYPPFDLRIIDSTGHEINFGNYRALERDLGLWDSPKSDWGLDILNRTSFHLFPQFPPDIRRRIWRLSIEPREVHVKRGPSLLSSAPNNTDPVWKSSTRLPAGLRICRESRSLLSSTYYARAIPDELDFRFMWVNFDIDTIRINEQDAVGLGHDKSLIRKLILETDQRARLLQLDKLSSYFEKYVSLEKLTIRVLQPYGNDFARWVGFLQEFKVSVVPKQKIDLRILDYTCRELNLENCDELEIE